MVFTVLCSFAQPGDKAKTPAKPNIIYILADGLGIGNDIGR